MTRTIRRGFYDDATPPPFGRPSSPIEGEQAVFEQYLAAIGAALEAIYFENQHFAQADVFDAVEAALDRDVRVLAVVPTAPSFLATEARRTPAGAALFERLARLAKHDRFSFVGLVADRGDHCEPIYVHSKVAIIDDDWATIGSTNVANRSFFGDTELNVSFWDHVEARQFRTRLLSAHHGSDLSHLTMTDALEAVANRADSNRSRCDRGAPIEGHVITLDATTWGAVPTDSNPGHAGTV